MSAACSFCGSVEPLTREHVFGKWLSEIGLDLSPARHRAGPLNRIPRDMGRQPPFRLQVKDVCASCNNGWMSDLEGVAQRVLTPLILGRGATIARSDQPLVALWAHKTALTAMLVSSQEQRDTGYGLAPGEYGALYARSSSMKPRKHSRFWVGRFEGSEGRVAARVTPLTVRIPGAAEPDAPQAYLMTIVVGRLALQGLQFTMPALDVEATNDLGMPQLWPVLGPVALPSGQPCTEEAFLRFADGRLLSSVPESAELRAWSRATTLPQSVREGCQIRVPAVCGEHHFYFPTILAQSAAALGSIYAFVTSCECGTAYLVHVEADASRCKAAGPAEDITSMFVDLEGEELVVEDEAGAFVCKQLCK